MTNFSGSAAQEISKKTCHGAAQNLLNRVKHREQGKFQFRKEQYI
jgi:hypothetical protein